MKSRRSEQKDTGRKLSRREFLGATSAAAAVMGAGIGRAEAATAFENPRKAQKAAATQLDKGTKVVHSVCLGCNSRCGVIVTASPCRSTRICSIPR